MKKNYLVLLFMFSIISAFAQYNVNINVTDAATMLDIETADVTFNGNTLQTDVNGDVTFANIADGVYSYSISKNCYNSTSGFITVGGMDVNESYALNTQTSAPVFVSTSNNPIIGSWVDGDIELTDGNNTYTYSVTEFDNIVANVAFGTYNYTFTRPGACDATGTVVVDCSTIEAQSGNVFLPILSEDQTSAPVFVSTSNNPIIGSWVDGDIELTDGNNTYTYSVTEFDNIVANVAFGTYNYTFTRPGACDATGTVVVDCSTIEAQSGNVFLPILSEDQTSAPVFVSTSNNPIIGSWVDGDIELTDGNNTYTYSVTEFDNIVANVAFGTYNYTFTRPGACDATGTVVVDCSTIEAQSGNVFLPILSEDQTSAPVFVSTSNNPIIGSWVDGDIELTDGNNTYTYSVTEFDNIVANVAFGTYNYTFTRPGACDATGTVVVDCSTIEAQSGNVFLPILSEDQTSAPVFVSTSNNPIIGSWVDGDIELTDGNNTYTYSVTEFDNIVANVAFGTYNYTFTRPGACDATGTVVVDCSTIEAQSGNVFLPILSEDQTSAPVFVSTSNNPIIGSWVDGDIELTDGNNTYTYSVTEFDNIVANVAFGTYNYTFTRPGACDATGTVVVDCSTIEAQSGNVFLPILSEDQTSAPVFVSTSNNPIIGSWVDGDIELTDGNNTYTYSVTEFDNIVANVAFGTYNYTFTRPGACDATGTVVVDCSTIEAQSGNVFLPILSEDQTSAPVFVSTSNNPIIGSWVDGDIELTDGNNTYTYSVTEFDNIVANVAFGTYNYTFTRPGACDATGTVVVDCSTIEAQSGNVFLPILSEDQTSAPVFVSTSNNPIIGSWVDGDIELTDGNNTYTYSVTEFDNIVANVAFGTYNYTFTRPGACDATGTVVVDCSTIEAQSGNVFLPILSEDQTSAPVFVSTSNNPIIGSWVDGDIELTDGNNTYTYSVTEFDNIVANVAFGTYNYTFTRPGACDATGTVVVDCSTIEAQSGNVFLPILSEDQTSAPVFVSTSNNPIIGSWVDGDIELTDGNNTYTYSVTEFDNIVANVAFGTYNYTFTRPGACDATGTVVVDCSTIEAQSGNVFLPILSEDQTSAPVFVSTSNNPIIGSWVDGDIELTDGNNTYTYSVTEFDNIVANVAFGTYNYTFTRPGACDATGTVVVDCSTIEAQSGNVFLPILSEDQTSAPVFVSTSNNPIIGSWVDGDIELTDGNNTYTYSVTEFDNIVANVAFGTYNYTFTRPGACDATGTVVVDCSTIEAQSGNVFLPILSEDQTSAPVFVSTSNNPIIGSWVDGDIELTDGNNTYTYSVTEFDNIVANVAFGTYNYTFTRPGACDATGTVVVDCSTIEAQSGNVFLPILSEDQTSAPVFVSTSNNPIIGSWVDGDIELTDGNNTYTYSVTEFDNIVANVAFGTYNYTFTRPGACDATGTVVVDCSTIEAQSGNVFLPILSEDQTSAPVFVSTSNNPIIGSWVDGDIELTDGNNTYTYSVTEFDNIVANVAFGTYNYTFTRPGACDATGTVVVDCSTIEAQSGNVFLPILSEDQTSAPVFVSTSNNPIIGSWVDGDIELTDGNNTYTYSVTEFDNIVANVAFGTYNYTFTRPGACDATGTVVVDCSTIEAQSGNVFLPILSEDQTSAPVFVSTSNNPIIGSWVDGDIELTDGNNTYTYSVTEFDNIVANVAFGTYNYTFTRPGACDATGTVVVDCSTIEAQSGNVFLPILSEDQTSAPVFVSTSNNPIIGSWVDGDIELTDGNNTYTYSVTEFDNIVANVAFGTYNYTFTRPGACDATGTVVVDCSTIEAQSGNVFLPILSEDATVDVSVTQNAEMLTANASGMGIEYQWIDCDNGNAPINGETNQMFTATINGNYAVIVTDSNCPISDMSTCYQVSTLNVEEFDSALSIKVYPNPVVNSLNITLGNTYQDINVQVYSITGQVIKKVNQTNKEEFNFNVSDLPSGSYILNINADGNTNSTIILKK